ncbi:hypothetical protein [Pedococcus sp. 5OH_020]|uniref:hypothetical protein n=1 Tax=Pedococcus sp. 5OH_020 TaxID=2989814 RepID=UPI0022E99B64|nr:hypothetical protein [Pedococcus sp. 5OH_020]
MSDRDVDAEFADIIAHWDDVQVDPRSTGEQGQLPQAPEGDRPPDPEPEPRPEPVNPPPESRAHPVNPPPTRPFVVWRGADQGASDEQVAAHPPQEARSEPHAAAEDEEEHFEPGPTAPLPPQEDLQFWGIIVGLVAGPLLLLWLVMFRPGVSGWWTVGALGLTIGGFVLLVLRQPHSRDEDDPDDGARV